MSLETDHHITIKHYEILSATGMTGISPFWFIVYYDYGMWLRKSFEHHGEPAVTSLHKNFLLIPARNIDYRNKHYSNIQTYYQPHLVIRREEGVCIKTQDTISLNMNNLDYLCMA